MLRLLLPAGVAAAAPHPATLSAQPGTSTGAGVEAAITSTLEDGAVTPTLYTTWETYSHPYDVEKLDWLVDSPVNGYCADDNVILPVTGDANQCATLCGTGSTADECDGFLPQEYSATSKVLCADSIDVFKAACLAKPNCGAFSATEVDQGFVGRLHMRHALCDLVFDEESTTYYRQVIDSHLYTTLQDNAILAELAVAPDADNCHWGEGVYVHGTSVDGAYQLASAADPAATNNLVTTAVTYSAVAGTGNYVEFSADTGYKCGLQVVQDSGFDTDGVTPLPDVVVASQYLPDYDGTCSTADLTSWEQDSSWLDAGTTPLYDWGSWKEAKSTLGAFSTAAYGAYWKKFENFYVPHNNIDESSWSEHLCINKCADEADRTALGAECNGWVDDSLSNFNPLSSATETPVYPIHCFSWNRCGS